MEISFCHFLMLYQIFLSTQVKRSAIISNKHGIYELPHELLNDLRVKETLKISFNCSIALSLTPKVKILSIPAKNCGKTEIKLFS